MLVQLEEQRLKGRDASETLQSFEDYNLACFSLLRDRVAKAPEALAAARSAPLSVNKLKTPPPQKKTVHMA